MLSLLGKESAAQPATVEASLTQQLQGWFARAGNAHHALPALERVHLS